MKTAYPAIIHHEEDQYWAEFPDIPGCYSDGDSIADVISNASEALGLTLCDMMDDGNALPASSDIAAIHPDDGVVTLVVTDPFLYKKNTKAVKKTLSIPEWLNVEAEKRHLNFSSILQQALISALE